MHWLDGISLDDNLISGRASGSNGENSDSNQRKAKSSTTTTAQTKAKRRRHAHYKLNSRLDRKSSRGMIYENEELRLRTININAEVERGQSDIKRLRRENEHLRREIWTLRDECDRLNKRFKAKILENEQGGGCNIRGSGGSGSCHARRGSAGGGGAAGCDGRHSNSQSEDSDSCDTCRGDDDQCSDDCCNDGSCTQLQSKQAYHEQQYSAATTTQPTASANSANSNNEVPNLHKTFDHLSVVSEETLSSNDLLQQQNEHYLGYTSDIHGSQATLPSLVGPLTPLTPIEQVANQLNDLQAMVPPLSYFENVLQKHMNCSIGTSPDSSSATSGSNQTVRHTNGWDYNLHSPFTQRKYSSTASSKSTTPILTTFVPTNSTATTNSHKSRDITLTVPKPTIAITTARTTTLGETVAITTMPTNSIPSLNNSPKHFFAPLKPRLKINTNLANKSLTAATVPVPPTTTTATAVTSSEPLTPINCDPPDIYVANALASPYQRQALPMPQPPLPHGQHATQTDSVNLETILNDIESISEDILAIQLEKSKSRENIALTKLAQGERLLEQDDKNKKPYRSEMNLLLSYDGTNPTITAALTTTATNAAATAATTTYSNNKTATQGNGSNGKQRFTRTRTHTDTNTQTQTRPRTRSLEREHTDSPSPNVPDPMAPFPDKHTYIGFDQLNNAVVATNALQMPPMTAAAAAQMLTSMGKPPPPTPPARVFPPTNMQNASKMTADKDNLSLGLSPNKSHLYAVIAHAAAKRAQYRDVPAQMTKSLDTELHSDNAEINEPTVSSIPSVPSASSMASMPKIEIDGNEVAAEAARQRKARRVSILCGETSVGTCDNLNTQAQSISSSHTINHASAAAAAPGTPKITTASCSDLPTIMLQNPTIKYLKQSSHSTPNSPHSTRRFTNSSSHSADMHNMSSLAMPPAATPTTPTTSHHQQQRKASQDSTRGMENSPQTATVTRTKCSRRNSDSGSTNALQRSSAASNGDGAGALAIAGNNHQHPHQHQHHHHSHSHSQQQSSAMFSTNPHHSHHSRRDSNHETATSLSDRNSNSLASSRESSTSFSMRSTRRKISISSHAGGKIPWCGCWGNGCL